MKDKVLSLRRVTETDCQLLWEWANDPTVRAVSFSQQPIPWETHVQWFRQKLHSSSCHWFTACDRHNTPIGQVRFEMTESNTAEIHLALAQAKRGFGYGTVLINLAVQTLFQTTAVQQIHALIKPDNLASIHAFEQAQFQKIGMITVKGHLALQYTCFKNRNISVQV
ncbi:MAG TPA: GNAT family N-acetyltransferase [Crinalium sp.]|jgi:RimJ/RimL family protein N-acetyltransferase